MEIINFKFEFESKFVYNPPKLSIYNNDDLVYKNTLVENSHTAEFDLSMSDQTENVLQVMRLNHDERTDQQLILKKVYADNIDLANILNQGKYYPNYPEPWHSQQKEQNNNLPEFYDGALCWGWNGVWKLEYTTPFYTWLLKNV